MLTQIGYVPNVAQADHTIEGLRQLIFIYPSALAVVTIVAMGCFYSLNEKMYVRIVEEIEKHVNARRNNNKRRPAGRYQE